MIFSRNIPAIPPIYQPYTTNNISTKIIQQSHFISHSVYHRAINKYKNILYINSVETDSYTNNKSNFDHIT